MRCPACGGRNADSAEWCTLCFAPLRETPPVESPPPAAADEPVAHGATVEEPAARRLDPAGAPASAADPSVTATSSDGRFRRTEEGLDWRCAACERWNPIERQTCATCRAPFARTVGAEDPGPRTDVSETAAVGASILLPGAGHVLLGRAPAGALRMFLYVTWLVGGVVLLRAAAGSGRSAIAALPLLVGALLVLLASVVEAQRTATGDETVLLTPRVTLWLVMAVVGGLMVAFFAAFTAVTP